MAVCVRELCEDDWRILKEVRLEALRLEPGVFSMRLEDEAGRDDAEWRALAANASDEQRVFGLFDGATMIGLTAVFTDRDDPSGATAKLAMSYIRGAYRGRRYSDLLYEARLGWIRRQGSFKKASVSHRRSNEASRRANQRHGFVESGAVRARWPDGAEEDEVTYLLHL